jgi:hypothetical protein
MTRDGVAFAIENQEAGGGGSAVQTANEPVGGALFVGLGDALGQDLAGRGEGFSDVFDVLGLILRIVDGLKELNEVASRSSDSERHGIHGWGRKEGAMAGEMRMMQARNQRRRRRRREPTRQRGGAEEENARVRRESRESGMRKGGVNEGEQGGSESGGEDDVGWRRDRGEGEEGKEGKWVSSLGEIRRKVWI